MKPVMTAFSVTVLAALAAAPAHADPDNAAVAYAAIYGGAICDTLDGHSSFAGIDGIAQAIHDDGLTWKQTGYAILLAVGEICPRHTALINAYARAAAA
jgi:hypothetical protein